MKLPVSYLCCLLFGMIIFQGCGPGSPGIWKNDQISSGKRDDFHKINDQLFAALKNNKPADVETLMSKELLENNYNKRLIELISLQCKSGGYNTFDEYYVVNYKPTDTHTLNTTSTDGTAYTFRCQASTEEMYFAFLIPKTTADKWMITAVYCKYNYGWKLAKLDMQQYTINGKNAPSLLKQAKQKYDKGYLIDAVNMMEIANKCVNPSDAWQYPQDFEVKRFYSQLVNEANNKFKFPLTISGVSTRPQIFRIVDQTTDEGVFPDIYYLSKINIKDTVALKKENEEVKKAIGKVLPGIDQDKKYIYFAAFNQLPEYHKETPSFDMTDKLK